MIEQLYEALFVVSLFGLLAAPVAGVVCLAWPRRAAARRRARTSEIQARA